MERAELIGMMAELKLPGMRAVYDEILCDGLKRERGVQEILGQLLQTERAEKQARSIRYRLGIVKLPTTKDLNEFDVGVNPVNEVLVRELHTGAFLATQRNAVLVVGIGTGKTHIAAAIAANCIGEGARARFFNVVDLVNQLQAEG